MRKRILGIAIIVPIGVGLVMAGGWVFTLGTALILAIAAWEYWHMFNESKYSPNKQYLLGAAALCTIARYAFSGTYFEPIFILLFIYAVVNGLMRFEHDDPNSIATFGFEIAGLIFIAYFGSYLVSLRFLPDGKMWVLLAIPAIGCGDIGAFLVGSLTGKHKMSPKVSPQKTIEGYFGGILFTVLYALLFSLIFTFGSVNITIGRSVLLGLILGIVSPLGDLLESLFKRSFNKKDAGKLIPGHGGVLDRIDTWLLGGATAYYIISMFWI